MNPVERAEAELKRLEDANKGVEPGEPAPPVAEPQPPAPPAEPPAAPQQPPVDYEQQWKSLKGIVKKKDEQIQQLIDSNQVLLERVNLLASLPAQPSAPQGTGQADLSNHLEGLVEEYGQPMLNAIQRVAEATTGGKIAALESRIQELTNMLSGLPEKVQHFEQKQANSESEAFIAKLAGKVPNWKQILDSSDFQVWSETTVEPFTGRTFDDLFKAANTDWNLDGMVGVFTAFAAATGRPVQPQPPTPQPPAADPRAALVTPGSKSGATSLKPGDDAKIWTQAEVAKVYDDMRRGVYSAEEQMRLDRELFEANAQGRIR